MTHVGGRIRSLRLERQMTLPALAECTGLSKGLLSKLENTPESNPSLETLQKIAKALKVTLSDFLDSGTVQVRRVVPDEPPPWLDSLTAMLKQEGKKPDEDILQALYVLQSRKGSSQRDASAWLHMYKSLELSFVSAKK
ncbi:MAG: helix-turn-helix domain-containing protein [Verrucomicrobiaceae bacterium]|nr:MAG: helix-turn-helix domain-containing protein [Verrucomicrobiaceae bacterium]